MVMKGIQKVLRTQRNREGEGIERVSTQEDRFRKDKERKKRVHIKRDEKETDRDEV
jgi:hypothetical protein